MKTKIFINARFLTQSITGVQRYGEELIYAFDALIDSQQIERERYEWIMLAPPNLKRKLRVKHIQLHVVGKLTGHLWEQIELPFYAANGLLVNLGNTAPILKRNQVVAIHDAAVKRHPEAFSFWFRNLYNVLFHILTRTSKLIITNSNFSKSELIGCFRVKESKIRVSYLGCEHIERIEKNDNIIKTYGLQYKRYILAVSSMNPLKNFQLIQTAIHLLQDFNIYVVIAGMENSRIFEDSYLEPNNRMIYVGYVNEQELRSLYENATCFVYPSKYEGFGLPPLEAMSMGCPVILSTAASLPEVYGESVLYCDPNDSYSLVKQLIKIYSDENLKKQLIQEGIDHAKSFRWQTCAQQVFAAIEEVLKDECGSRP
ncbi:glycosyltransferase [Schinkia azotoformans MEV2011]|uniref:Glycosyltransferase n=1 Tax=Schinkia azotoformans MEV2011 TaxID=1348973 RepID=A0A072NQ08_SCHAZ|nr:glycosyltransferase family 1 protein [Schinkia azotoformans]KEF39754.1 glycosyltransferase [Schinkia azotoformans MEV2011]MEC1695027.1 glycosyltransferase family 1 protein [Schinkia azotoformans]MEC1716364.1 glycosyltransferase family 1 protein [Schinkia azotoformans]MEC1726833.1 glycosyltransferase family 1 protein [Schinkia azotoformans]MEC1740013.1 glycosyltransferase family 1 protein [Schinkia azotoformans]